MCAAALSPTPITTHLEGTPDSLKAFLEPTASYGATPEAYCFGLLEWFDCADLKQLAQKR